MNTEEIKEILPHRSSMLLIDEAEYKDGKAFAKKHITGNEWFLDGHFPGNPVVPGVILCEILAQSTCVALGKTIDSDKVPYFTGLKEVKFKRPVKPDDLFETECEIVRVKEPFYFCKGKGSVNGKVCVTAEFSFAIVNKED